MSFLFGGGTPQVQFNPKGITNPTGFNVSPQGAVSNSPTLAGNIGGLQSTFGQQAGALGALGATVAPGFSQFRQAGLADISNTFAANRSNLRDTLAQRRILGSSFANASLSQNAADEAQTKADFEAQSYLQELQSSYQLIQSQYQAQTSGYSAAINQSNIEASTAASLVASNNATAAQIATANAQLQAQAQAGAGSFLGTMTGALLGKGGLPSLFGGSGGGSIGTDATVFNNSTGSFLDDVGSYLGDAAAAA